jgi:ADP-dependent NAD(P)H-hydrate dehydratase / NAD(P)H-hydrate epimerase
MKHSVVDKSILKRVYKQRDLWTHKGQYGKLLVIAGSERITGAPILIAKSALRAGCDTIFLVGPKRAMDSAAFAYPTFVNQPLEGRELIEEHLPAIITFVNDMKPSGIAIGPGLWRTEKTRKAVVRIVENFNLPIVIDADAIRAMSAAKEILKRKTAILTPHSNEFSEFSGIEVTNNIEERMEAVKSEAKKWQTIILLKGNVDVISDGKKVAINKTGNPFMSKGGCGDTLTGICAAFLARKVDEVDPFDAACAAAYINGRAGDIAARKFRSGLLPTDLIDCIPEAIS